MCNELAVFSMLLNLAGEGFELQLFRHIRGKSVIKHWDSVSQNLEIF